MISSTITLTLAFSNRLSSSFIPLLTHLIFVLPGNHLHFHCSDFHSLQRHRRRDRGLNSCWRWKGLSIISNRFIRQICVVLAVCSCPVFFKSFNCFHPHNPWSLALQRPILHCARSPIIIHSLRVFHGSRMTFAIHPALNNHFFTNHWNDRDCFSDPFFFLRLYNVSSDDEMVMDNSLLNAAFASHRIIKNLAFRIDLAKIRSIKCCRLPVRPVKHQQLIINIFGFKVFCHPHMVVISPTTISHQTFSSHILHVLWVFLFKNILRHVFKDERKAHVLFRRSPCVRVDINRHGIWNGRDENVLVKTIVTYIVCDNPQKPKTRLHLKSSRNVIMRWSI